MEFANLESIESKATKIIETTAGAFKIKKLTGGDLISSGLLEKVVGAKAKTEAAAKEALSGADLSEYMELILGRCSDLNEMKTLLEGGFRKEEISAPSG